MPTSLKYRKNKRALRRGILPELKSGKARAKFFSGWGLIFFYFWTLPLAWAQAPNLTPLAPGTQSLTLEKAIEISIEQATQVLQGENQYKLTAIQLLQAYGQFLPNLNVGGNYGYQAGKTLYAINGLLLADTRGQTAALTVSSTLNLFNGLSDYAGLHSAIERRQSSEFSLDWARQQVALDVTQSYLQVTLDEQLLEIARKNLQASQARLRLLKGEEKVGSVSISDLYRQTAETSAGSYAVASAESRLSDDQILLIRKLRVDPSREYRFEAPDLKPTPSPLSARPVSELIDQAISKRADSNANATLLEATHWELKRAESGYLPRLDLALERDAAGQYLSRQYANGVNTIDTSQTGLAAQLGNQVDYSISLNLTWNVFDRFVTRLNIEQARTVEENTQLALEDTRLQIAADIRTAHTHYQIAWQQLANTQVGLDAAEKSFQSIEGQYQVGSASIVDALTAQAALVQTRSEEAQARTNLKLQERVLAYSVGQILGH